MQTQYPDELDVATFKFKIKEEALNLAVEKACRQAAGLKREKEQLRKDVREQAKEIKVLRDQIAI